MKSSLREKLEPAVQTPAASEVQSGSPESVELRWTDDFHDTIDAIKALRDCDCGLTLLDAKRKIEELMATKVLFVDLPAIGDEAAFVQRIAQTGAIASIMTRKVAR